jgi:hypothetical protein
MTENAFLRMTPRITLLPIIHGSGDFAIAVRNMMLAHRFDCLAVPLPPSFQAGVEAALEQLPGISLVVQEETRHFKAAADWSPESERRDSDASDRTFSYVPIDPCQGVIAALRFALSERIPRAFIDLETACFCGTASGLPDPYALKKLPVEKFAASLLPLIPRVPAGQATARVVAMAQRLRELEQRHQSILCLCSLLDWPWIREAYHDRVAQTEADDHVEEARVYAADPGTLLFLLGELPFVTGLYERARRELDDDENLSIDGVKELLLLTRDRYEADLKSRARDVTPHLLATYLRYVRNLCLIERRMTPDLYTLVTAAQQIAGDQFALHLAETAREYPVAPPLPFEQIQLGIEQARLPDGDVVHLKSRLPGQPLVWRTCQLRPRPTKHQEQAWALRWNPFQQCSWQPEDVAIETFRTHIKDSALSLIGADLARSEKFTTSMMDGLDIRETLRNWHTGDLYVKLIPPTRGTLDCVVMLFDSPADPRDYPWRITWMAEHHDESTLALFATDFQKEIIGPGIGLATYGGALFLFPPRPIPEVWTDPRLDFCTTLEERLLAAACLHSREKHIALLSAYPPGLAWRRLAKRFRKKLVHVPLSRFSQEKIQQLRLVHVLNGRRVRSYAADFIRKA